jgi:hypothetical protein
MKHRLLARMVAAGLVVMVAGTARAQDGDESRTLAKLQAPQTVLTKTMASASGGALAAAGFRSTPTVWPPQPVGGFPNIRRNSRSSRVLARVAIGLMCTIVGASIATAAGLQFGR